MKVIALLPFKNEEKHLPTYLSNVKGCVDQIIAIDDGSTDKSREMLETAGALVISNDTINGWGGMRKKLLDLGRANGGTHFVCLDADETFTGQFPGILKQVCTKLVPGQKITMQWLALWKAVDHYRDDHSVWSNNYKDFIFCDDGKMDFEIKWIHEPRTPGPTTEENTLKLNSKYGAVLHFQFSDWKEFQLKQSWYRCRERAQTGKPIQSINETYRITLDDNQVVLRKIPDEWMKNVIVPEMTGFIDPSNWRLKQIEEWFDQHGASHFKDLDIQQVPEIQKLFEVKNAL
ncbi:MAG: glycosyltransferase [Candidatus Paceibacterota bacterium]|jgi:hypothetical protein